MTTCAADACFMNRSLLAGFGLVFICFNAESVGVDNTCYPANSNNHSNIAQ